MASRLANALGLALVATLIEQAVLPKIGLGSLLEKGSSGLTAASFLPTGYGLVIIIVTFTYLWVLMYGMKVGGARSKYAELAEKDGEKDVEARYKLPNLYAQGTSKNARAFNCVQRSHQQILETLPGYFVTVLVSGLEYPVATFVFGSLWLYSRSVWVVGYSDSSGDPALRYSHPHSRVFWHCKLALLMMSWFVAIQLLVGKKIFWDSLLK
mmetsp:Transcript_19773/g.49188  ORF Transcript_19773/g.49188 Transcript_19773/m.49188 type:complete len:211 (-) Transcript_19773:2054-2686(-)